MAWFDIKTPKENELIPVADTTKTYILVATGKGRGNRAAISATVTNQAGAQVANAAKAAVAPPHWVVVLPIASANVATGATYALTVTQRGINLTRRFQFVQN